MEKTQRPTARDVYDFLLTRVGEANAISGAELSARFNISERHLRTLVREMRDGKDFHKTIGSGNRGYYVCANKEELRKSNRRMGGQMYSIMRTTREQERKAMLDGQIKIPTEDGAYEYYSAFGAPVSE